MNERFAYDEHAIWLGNWVPIQVGKEKMDHLLQNYFRKYQNEIATGSDFISVFSEELGPEAKEYFENWLNGKEPEFKQ